MGQGKCCKDISILRRPLKVLPVIEKLPKPLAARHGLVISSEYYMKKLIIIMALVLPGTRISAESLYIEGDKRGEIEPDGDVYIGGSKKGQIESDGDVYVDGSKVGEIESDGDVYLNGSKVGQIESDGDVYNSGSKIGLVESDGDIYKNGSRIGECKNVPREWVGAVVFFFFSKDLGN